MPSDLNSVSSDGDVRPVALPLTNSPSSRIDDQASLPAATSSRNSPASTLACSTWSVALTAARKTVTASTSRRSWELAPATLTCAPAASHCARQTGLAELVMVTTTSASATQVCAEEAGSACTPSSFSTTRAYASRCSAVREKTLTRVIGLTAHTAAICVRDCLPVPMTASVCASALAKSLVATPLAAPVRICPSRSGLDDRLELAVERGVEERVKLRALHPGIGLEPVHPLRAIGSAHQVEGAARKSRALPRQITC